MWHIFYSFIYPPLRNQAKFTLHELAIAEWLKIDKPMLKQCLCLCLKILTNLFVYSNPVVERRENGFILRGGQKYRLRGAVVPGDFSGAAFPLTAGALGGAITLSGLDLTTAQGDKAILDVLRLAGAQVSTEGDEIRVKKGKLHSFTADVGETPDLAPILSVLAAFCEGESVLRTVSRLRDKESDRLSAIEDMLSRAGIASHEEGDALVVCGGVPKGGAFRSYSDHRMAMSEAVLAAYCVGESEIDDMTCVGKSYPRFWEDFAKWGGIYEVER